MTVDLGLFADGIDLWLRGSLGALADDLAMDVEFGAGHPSFAGLAQTLGWQGLAADSRMLEGPIALRGTAEGTFRDLQVGLAGQLAGADLGLVGGIGWGWGDPVTYQIEGSVHHDHAALVLAGFGR
jgi:hypothetical protein